MPSPVRISALAEADLMEVWRYTAERWGSEQADVYLDAFGAAFRQLAAQPLIGAKRGGVREGYRVLFVGEHAVYYRVDVSVVGVVRVLHGRMDPRRHLQ